MSAADLSALAERCEAAPGLDRELDAAIYDLTPHALDYQRIGLRLKDMSRLDRYHDGWVTVYGAKGEADPYPEDLARYTASLDAAMTLVPAGWRIGDLSQHDHPILRAKGDWTAWVYPDGKLEPVTGDRPRCRFAATPALALTAAALRCRAALFKGGVQS